MCACLAALTSAEPGLIFNVSLEAVKGSSVRAQKVNKPREERRSVSYAMVTLSGCLQLRAIESAQDTD